jgi:CheY-like chemotaxis protein
MFTSLLLKPVKASLLYNALIPIFAGEIEEIIRHNTLPQFDPSMGGRHPLRILLVEDNIINQNLALLMLERMGYKSDVANNGNEALQAIRKKTYDAVFMDIQMPEMDGLEATQHIRQDFSLNSQPRIIAMTANALSGDRETCLEAGMDDYISKPVRIEELVNCLNRCQTREIHDQAYTAIAPEVQRAKPVISFAAGPSGDVIDVDELMRLKATLGAKVDINLPALVYSYFKQAETLLNEMKLATRNQRMDDLYRSAHTLASNSADVGARSLANISHQVAEQARNGNYELIESLIKIAEDQFENVRSELRASLEIPANR